MEVNYANSNVQLDFASDCKSKKYIELLVTPSIRKVINGRFYLNQDSMQLEKILPESKLPSNIKLRSPIYCKQPNNNICSTCYGELGEKLNTRHIGLLSGSIINKVGLNNYSMKARHQSSQVQLRPVSFISDFIRIS